MTTPQCVQAHCRGARSSSGRTISPDVLSPLGRRTRRTVSAYYPAAKHATTSSAHAHVLQFLAPPLNIVNIWDSA